MTPADELRIIPFTPDLLGAVGGFDFGPEPYQRELVGWVEESAAETVAQGGRVWLYATAVGDIVGFGSLGRSNWRYPDVTSKRVSVAIIPALALRREFWGGPPGAAWPDRCSGQILRHIIGEAATLPGPPPVVGLYVHPNNAAAIKLYERFGFVRHNTWTDKATDTTYHGYARELAPPPATA